MGVADFGDELERGNLRFTFKSAMPFHGGAKYSQKG
jgi:hypothetical protein